MADTKTSAQELLQRRADQNQRAQEVIDKDPEEAHAVLERHTSTNDGSPITVQDMFSLFRQLQQQQAAMQQQMMAQQEQLIAVLSNQKKVDQQTKRDTQRELEEAAAQQRATLQAWKDEPREPVWIQPEMNEEKIHAVMNEYPPRVYRVNGLEFPIAVGEVVNVPSSIAALVRHSQKQKPLTRAPQSIPEIPDPNRGQFLAAASEVSAGRAGTAGEGWVQRVAVASDPSTAQPLDARYDAYGR